jgi:hypothetical protein
MLTIDKLLEDEKDIAINFLKKIFDNKNNLQLSEIKKGLDLDFIEKHINNKRLNDIFENDLQENINKLDINNNKYDIKKESKRKFYKIDIEAFNRLALEIVPENEEGIELKRIVEYINQSMGTEYSNLYIYTRLRKLRKQGIINSYIVKSKGYWFRIKK